VGGGQTRHFETGRVLVTQPTSHVGIPAGRIFGGDHKLLFHKRHGDKYSACK